MGGYSFAGVDAILAPPCARDPLAIHGLYSLMPEARIASRQRGHDRRIDLAGDLTPYFGYIGTFPHRSRTNSMHLARTIGPSAYQLAPDGNPPAAPPASAASPAISP